MTTRLSVAQRPPRHAVLDRPALAGLTRRLLGIARTENLRALTLVLTDDAHSEAFNGRLLRHDGPTDVITQAYDPFPGEPPGRIAELYINLDRAQAVGGTRAGRSPNHELLLYIAHGLDHLNGHDDATPAQRRAMRRRELAWLRRLVVPEAPLFKPRT